jgi:hypothetical protein
MRAANLLKLPALVAGSGIMFLGFTAPVQAVGLCGHDWAEPGKYMITGNFRGKEESAGAELTRDCRINLKIPGVYTGGKVSKDGGCVRFTFKVEDEQGLFKGRWCNDTATVNWKGKDVQATIRRVGFQ